jgi:predicted Zn finger-like uncharacterized protein
MLIVCPSCSSGYNIDAAKLGPAGREVRCAACGVEWFVAPESEPEASAAPVLAQSSEPAQAPAAWTPPPAADPFDEEAMAREWAMAETAAEDEVAAAGQTADAITAADSAMQADTDPSAGQQDNTGGSEPGASGPNAAEAFAAAAAAAAASTPWWKKLLRRKPAKARPAKAKPVKTPPEPMPAEPIVAAAVIPDAPSAPPPAAKPIAKAAIRRSAKPAGTKISAVSPARLLRSPLAAGIVGISLLGITLWQREAVVRIAPSSAPVFAAVGLPVNLAGLVFADVRSAVHREAEGRFMVVEGAIRSVAADSVRVPLIELRIRGEDGRTVYTWTAEPPRRSLRAGESLHFRTRLATPPEAARDVEVRFTDWMQSAQARP